MNSELQKDEFYLKGDLGTVTIGSTGERKQVTNFIKHSDGSGVTFTISPIALPESTKTEDIDHEVINPKLLTDKKCQD